MTESETTGLHEAVASVEYAWHNYSRASTPILQAYWLGKVDDAIGDLITFHPDYDLDTGEIADE